MALYSVGLHRFTALALIGVFLLVVYQFVFMTRTSPIRDYNHLHGIKYSSRQSQQLALHRVDSDRIEFYNPLIQAIYDGERPLGDLLSMFPEKPHGVQFGYVSSLICNDEVNIEISNYSSVFQYLGKSKEFNAEDVGIIQYSDDVSLSSQLDDALKRYKAVVYLVPEHWVPLFGAFEYEMPIVAVHAIPQVLQNYTFVVETPENDESSLFEYEIQGITRDLVVIGDERNSANATAAFYELYKVCKDLKIKGWKPIRTLKFVSFPRNRGNLWAQKHRHELHKYADVYIELGPINGLSAYSPALEHVVKTASDQLVDAGVIAPFNWTLTPSFMLLDHKLQTVTIDLESALETARLAALIMTVFTDEPVLPYRLAGYDQFLEKQSISLSGFDNNILQLKRWLTIERPWFQFMDKLRDQFMRKTVNYKLKHFEDVFNTRNNKHAVFELNNAGTSLLADENPKELERAVHRIQEFKSGKKPVTRTD